jgi:hypothetical protein
LSGNAKEIAPLLAAIIDEKKNLEKIALDGKAWQIGYINDRP